MKLITAVLHPEELALVQAALSRLGVGELSISQVYVKCQEAAYTLIYRSATIPVHFVPRVKVEAVVEDDAVEATVAAIVAARFCGVSGPAAPARIHVRSLDLVAAPVLERCGSVTSRNGQPTSET